MCFTAEGVFRRGLLSKHVFKRALLLKMCTSKSCLFNLLQVVEDMSMTLLQFTATLRGHAQSFVRKACIYCLTMITLSVRTLTQRLNDVTLDARDWLCDVIANDEDTQARQLASNCLALMSSKVREELAVDR